MDLETLHDKQAMLDEPPLKMKKGLVKKSPGRMTLRWAVRYIIQNLT